MSTGLRAGTDKKTQTIGDIMEKLWKRWERDGTAGAIRALGGAVVVIALIAFGVWATGGFELFDSLKGF